MLLLFFLHLLRRRSEWKLEIDKPRSTSNQVMSMTSRRISLTLFGNVCPSRTKLLAANPGIFLLSLMSDRSLLVESLHRDC